MAGTSLVADIRNKIVIGSARAPSGICGPVAKEIYLAETLPNQTPTMIAGAVNPVPHKGRAVMPNY
jgi:hypothetical protein